jgi:hypothetical protein
LTDDCLHFERLALRSKLRAWRAPSVSRRISIGRIVAQSLERVERRRELAQECRRARESALGDSTRDRR